MFPNSFWISSNYEDVNQLTCWRDHTDLGHGRHDFIVAALQVLLEQK